MKAFLRSIGFALAGLPFIACGTPADPREPRAAWSLPTDGAVGPVSPIETAPPAIAPAMPTTIASADALGRSVARSDSDGTELIVGNVARRPAAGLSGTRARGHEPAGRLTRCEARRCPGAVIEVVGGD